MKLLLKYTPVFLALYTVASYAKPLPDEIYNKCIKEGYAGNTGKEKCETNLIERKRIESYYARYDDYPGYKETYDRFKKEYLFYWHSPISLDGKLNKRFSIYADKNNYNSAAFIISLSHIGEYSDKYIDCGPTDWLLDDERFIPSDFQEFHDEDNDIFSSSMTESEFQKILKAKKIEYKYCGVEGVITDNEKRNMQYVYRRYLDEKDVSLPPNPLWSKPD